MKSLLSSRLILVLVALNVLVLVGLGLRQFMEARDQAERRRVAALRGAEGLERIGAIRSKDHLRLSEISMSAEKTGEIGGNDFDYICGVFADGPPSPGTKQASTFYVDLLFTLSRPKRYSADQRQRIAGLIAPLLTPTREDPGMIVPTMAALLARKVGDNSLAEPLRNLQKSATGKAKTAATEALATLKT